MAHRIYRGYKIDKDDLGRWYIYNTASPYAEDSDHILVSVDKGREITQIHAIIDTRIAFPARDCRSACIHNGTAVIL